MLRNTGVDQVRRGLRASQCLNQRIRGKQRFGL